MKPGIEVTEAEKEHFLRLLEGAKTVFDAVMESGRGRETWYRVRRRDPEFCRRWDELRAEDRPVRAPDSDYVPIGPYREAIKREVAHGARAEFGRMIGISDKRWKSLQSARQKTLPVAEANAIAQGLGRADLFVDEVPHVYALSTSASDTIGRVGVDPCPESGGTPIGELLERSDRAWKLLKFDNTVHPLDALAMVVWPPERVLEEVA